MVAWDFKSEKIAAVNKCKHALRLIYVDDAKRIK